MKKSPIFVLIQGQAFQPTTCQLEPTPPHPMLQGMGKLAEVLDRDILDGEAFGPMTHDEALSFASALSDYKTLCIIPCGGLQAVWLNGLAWHRVQEALGYRLPGLHFFAWSGEWNASEEACGIVLIGYGKPFAGIHTEDAIASCTPDIAFPLGPVWVEPDGEWCGTNRQRRDWIPQDMTTFPDLALLVEFLRTLNLTDKYRVDFQAAEILRGEEERRAIEENRAWWAAKHAAGETVDLGNGVWGLKPDAQEAPPTRVLLS